MTHRRSGARLVDEPSRLKGTPQRRSGARLGPALGEAFRRVPGCRERASCTSTPTEMRPRGRASAFSRYEAYVRIVGDGLRPRPLHKQQLSTLDRALVLSRQNAGHAEAFGRIYRDVD